jgi:tetratricopeptide (TPR) repeat protein
MILDRKAKAARHRLLLTLGGACLFLGVTGCDQLPDFSGAKPRDLADQAVAAGDFPRAVRFYETALDGTAATADLHYRLAIVYDSHLQDATSAIHHYRRYLRMADAPSRRQEIERSIERLQRDVATRLGEGGLVSRSEAVRLRNENNELRKQIASLRAPGAAPAAATAATSPEVRRAQPVTSPPPVDAQGLSTVAQTRAAEAVVGPETRTYTVQKGDTLASISRRFYQTSARWKDIADANHNQLQGSTNIREGQVLVIP